MTQFLLVRGNLASIPVPEGVEVSKVERNEFLLRAAEELFSGTMHGDLYSIIDSSSGEADALLDELHNCITQNIDIETLPLISYLQQIIALGVDVAFWYGSSWTDLPLAKDWPQLLEILIHDASFQPPELYLRTGFVKDVAPTGK